MLQVSSLASRSTQDHCVIFHPNLHIAGGAIWIDHWKFCFTANRTTSCAQHGRVLCNILCSERFNSLLRHVVVGEGDGELFNIAIASKTSTHGGDRRSEPHIADPANPRFVSFFCDLREFELKIGPPLLFALPALY